MANNKKHFEEFEPHTLLKHVVLRAYLQTWARKMLLRPGATNTICIVDACAGAGRDSKGNPGSPVLAAEVARDAERHLQAEPEFRGRFSGPLRIQVIAIEKDAKRHQALVENLVPFERRARALHGTLANYINGHYAVLGGTPTLFFVDPFGLAPLQADVIRQALFGPRNEVLLLFAGQAALRHFGAATAVPPDLSAEVAARLPAQLSIFEDPDVERQRVGEATAKWARTKSDGQNMTKPRAIEILNAAFGGSGWGQIIAKTPRPKRRSKFLEMYVDLLHSFGATHVLPLPMRNDRDQHVYTLLHATQSVHGYTAMKRVVSSALNQATLPADAIASMRFQIATDLGKVEEEVRRHFAGKSVAWKDQKDGRGSIRQFVLEETTVFDFELRALKQLLKNEKTRGRGPEFYTFPLLPNR